MFPKAPIADDLAFVRGLMDEGILAVPGSGFGRAGYFRLSLTIPHCTIERALPDSSAPCIKCSHRQNLSAKEAHGRSVGVNRPPPLPLGGGLLVFP